MPKETRSISCPFCGRESVLTLYRRDPAGSAMESNRLELTCPLKHTASTQALAPLWNAVVRERAAAAKTSV